MSLLQSNYGPFWSILYVGRVERYKTTEWRLVWFKISSIICGGAFLLLINFAVDEDKTNDVRVKRRTIKVL